MFPCQIWCERGLGRGSECSRKGLWIYPLHVLAYTSRKVHSVGNPSSSPHRARRLLNSSYVNKADRNPRVCISFACRTSRFAPSGVSSVVPLGAQPATPCALSRQRKRFPLRRVNNAFSFPEHVTLLFGTCSLSLVPRATLSHRKCL